jgi:hypothetical protein
MELVLTRGAVKAGVAQNAICLKSEPGRKWGKREPAAASIVAVFTGLPGESGGMRP